MKKVFALLYITLCTHGEVVSSSSIALPCSIKFDHNYMAQAVTSTFAFLAIEALRSNDLVSEFSNQLTALEVLFSKYGPYDIDTLVLANLLPHNDSQYATLGELLNALVDGAPGSVISSYHDEAFECQINAQILLARFGWARSNKLLSYDAYEMLRKLINNALNPLHYPTPASINVPVSSVDTLPAHHPLHILHRYVKAHSYLGAYNLHYIPVSYQGGEPIEEFLERESRSKVSAANVSAILAPHISTYRTTLAPTTPIMMLLEPTPQYTVLPHEGVQVGILS